MNSLDDLLKEIRELRKAVERNEVTRAEFDRRTATIRGGAQSLGVNFDEQLQDLRTIANFNLDLSGLVNQLTELDRLARNQQVDRETFEQQAQTLTIRAEANNLPDISNELDRIRENADFSGESFEDLTRRIFFFREAVQTLVGSISGLVAPFREAVESAEAFNQNLLQTRILFSANTRSFDAFGNEIFDFQKRIAATREEFAQLQKDLEISTQSIAGLTTAGLNEILAQTTQNIANLQGQSTRFVSDVDILRNLVPQLAAALGTLQIDSFQVPQELRALLTGDVSNPDALVAQRLGLTRTEVDQARAQGRFVDLLEERLAPLVAGNQLAANSLTNIISNFQDINERLQRGLGEGLLEPLTTNLGAAFAEITVGDESIQNLNETLSETQRRLNAIRSIQNIQATIDAGGLTDNQAQQLRASQERFAEGAGLEVEVALAITDTTDLEAQIAKIESDLEAAPEPLANQLENFIINLGNNLGMLLDEALKATRELVSLLNNVGVTQVLQDLGDFTIGVVRATTGITRAINATLGGVNSVFESFRGQSTEEFEAIQGAAELTATQFGRLGDLSNAATDSLSKLTGTLFKAGGLIALPKLLTTITGALGNIFKLLSSSPLTPTFAAIANLQGGIAGLLSQIPILGGFLGNLVTRFTALGRIIPGIGQALIALDAFKFTFRGVRALLGFTEAEREFAESAANIRSVLEQTADNVIDRYAGLGQLVGSDLINAQQQFAGEAVALQEEIDRIREALPSLVDKGAREQAEGELDLLVDKLDELKQAANDAGVELERTAPKALTALGTIGSKLASDITNDFEKLVNNIDAIGSQQLPKFVQNFVSNLEEGVTNGVITATDAVEKLLALEAEDRIAIEDRKPILELINKLREQELNNATQLLDIEGQINNLKVEAGELSRGEADNLDAQLRLQKAIATEESKRQRLADLRRSAEITELDPQLLQQAEAELTQAVAESAAARANIRTTEAETAARVAQRAVDEALNAEQALFEERKRLAIETGSAIELDLASSEVRLEQQQAELNAAVDRLAILNQQITGTEDLSKRQELETEANQQSLDIERQKTGLLEAEIALENQLLDTRLRLFNLEVNQAQAETEAAQRVGQITQEQSRLIQAQNSLSQAEVKLQNELSRERQDQEKIASAQLEVERARTQELEAQIAVINSRDVRSEVRLEQQAQEGLITRSEQQAELARQQVERTRERIALLEQIGGGDSIRVEQERLQLLLDQKAQTESILAIEEERLNNNNRLLNRVRENFSLIDNIAGQIESRINQANQTRIADASEEVQQAEELIARLEGASSGERTQILRELSTINSNAAQLAGTGNLEQALSSLDTQRNNILELQEEARREEEAAANKRLEIEQRIAEIRFQSTLNELELERIRAQQIEDPAARQETLDLINDQEGLIRLQQELQRDPDSVDFGDIDRAIQQQGSTGDDDRNTLRLISTVEELTNIVRQLEVSPTVEVNMQGSQQDNLLPSKLLLGL